MSRQNMSLSFPRTGKLFIGVVHLPPLPGSPRWRGEMRAVVQSAVADAKAYERGGVHAVIIENFGDVPFTKNSVPPETVAAMAVATSAVHEAVHLPVGFNVLRNDAHAALALCGACGGSFIRVNVHCGAMLTDQGVIEGQAFHTLRLRRQLCPGALIFADVHVKHAVPVGDWPLEHAARDTAERGLADALIVSGTGTGITTNLEDVRRVRAVCPRARIVLGSGVTSANIHEFLPFIDGVIVGTSLKRSGSVDARRVSTLAAALRA